MPNWCSNRVELRHDDRATIQAAVDAFRNGKLLSFASPTPPDLERDGAEIYAGGEEGEVYQAIRTENVTKYGYKSWYDWRIANWGTKWDVDGDIIHEDENSCEVVFDSAWSPPIEAYRSLEEKGFSVRALYYEPGCDFAGLYDTESGEYNLSVEAALISDIGPELDEAFGISEMMANMEVEIEE